MAEGNERSWTGTTVSQGEASFVRLHEPTDPNAVATVTFQNREVHDQAENFVLVLDEFEVTIGIYFNVGNIGAEGIEVVPPEGYIAIPQYVEVLENTTEEIQIYPYLGY